MAERNGIRWVRTILCGLAVEIVTIALIICVVLGHKAVTGADDAASAEFGGKAGFVIGVFGGAILSAVFGWIAARGSSDSRIISGLIVGLVAGALHTVMFLASDQGYQAIFAVADILKIAGGALGGYLAGRGRI